MKLSAPAHNSPEAGSQVTATHGCSPGAPRPALTDFRPFRNALAPIADHPIRRVRDLSPCNMAGIEHRLDQR